MTLAPIRSASHAVSYFERSEHSDYYLYNDVCPSVWAGKAAEHLGVAGQVVTPSQFKRFLDGEIAGFVIGAERAGQRQHKPGWDLQFAPSKSVSVVALVGGDQRVIEAHDRAVNDALAMLEKQAVFTRTHTRGFEGKDQYQQQVSDNLLAAMFRHDTSRSLDPQLHSHAVVLNATLRANGQWRSLESRHFYALQKEAGLAYRQSLAASLRELGYDLQRTADSNFEITGVPDELLASFSQRRDVIDIKLAELGLTRDTAPAHVKEKIAHDTRVKKVTTDRVLLLDQWRGTSKQHGLDAEHFARHAHERSVKLTWNEEVKVKGRDQLEKLIKQVISTLSERDAIFSRAELVAQLNSLAVGYGISCGQVTNGVEWAEAQELIIAGKTTHRYSSQFQCWKQIDAYTTPEALRLEKQMIETMLAGRCAARSEFSSFEIENIIKSAVSDSKQQGFDGWTAGQKTAVRAVLSSADQFIAVQGYAGTAKTSTALKTIAIEYEGLGYQVIGMAPSASACAALLDGAKLDHVVTVASHLLKPLAKDSAQKKQLWLVDEASLLATKDMSRLLEKARSQQAKVVLVGDIKQLGSVEAGAAFRQLQDNGIVTYELDEIVRQKNEYVLDSVHHSLVGDAERALEVLAEGGGRVVETSGDAGSRHKEIVDQYINLTQDQRKETLVIDPSREGCDQLNEYLRQGLKLSGDISHEEIKTQRLERVDLTKAAAQDVLNYQAEDVIRFSRAYKSKQIDKNSYWSVRGMDSSKGVVELAASDGQTIVWNPAAWGAKSQVFRRAECSLSIGDKLIWSVNDRELGVTNGSKAVVQKIDIERETAEIEFASGCRCTVSLNDHQYQHWSYDYVTTVHAAQGKTADRVIFHAESFRRNLSSQKALYVAISRSKHEVTIYTDSKDKLIEQIKEHAGEKQYANEKTCQVEYDMN